MTTVADALPMLGLRITAGPLERAGISDVSPGMTDVSPGQ